jgi:hypothetical protein
MFLKEGVKLVGHARILAEYNPRMTDEVLKELLEAMRSENSAGHAETRREFAAALAELKRQFADTRKESAAAHLETRHLFEVSVEQMKSWFNLLAEGIQTVDEKLDRRTTALDQKIDQTAAETQALIKFLHDEHSRRISALEDQRRVKK